MPDHPDLDVGAAVTDAADRLATRTPALAEVTKRAAQRRQRRIAIGAGLASVVLTVVVAVGLSFDGDRTVTEAPIATDGETSSTTTTTTTTVVDPDQETVVATIDEVPLIPSDLPDGFALRGFSSGAPGVDQNHRPSRTYALSDGDELVGVIQVSSTSSSEFEGWQGAIEFEVDGRPAGLFVINSSQASARVEIDDERSIVVFVEVRTSDEVDIDALRHVLTGGVITEDGPAVEPEALPVGYRLVDEDLVPENVTSEMVTIFGDGTRELVLIQRRGELRGLDRRTCCRTIWTETTMGVDDEYVGVTNLFDPGPLIEPEPGLQIRFQSYDFTGAELDRVVSSLHRPAVTDWEPLVERVASTPPSSAKAPDGVTFLAPGPLDRREGSAQTASDSEILIWGGRTDTEDRSDGAAYDVADESWRVLPDGPHPPGHSDAVWTGTEMVLVDRYSADQVAEPVAVSAFNPSTNEWRSLPPVPIEGPVEKVVNEGTDVVVLAGTDRGYRMAVMDTTTDSWTVLPDPPSVVLFPSIAVTDGYISYVGSKPLSENVQVGDLAFRVYVFDRSTDQWGEFVGPEQFGGNLRADQFLAEFVDGELIVVGETAVTGDPNGFSSGAVDPATGQWRIIDASELSACVQHEIMLVNRVLVRVACGVGDGLLLPGAGAWEVSSTEPFATPFWGGVAFGDALYQFSGCGDQGYCANSFKRLDLAALMP